MGPARVQKGFLQILPMLGAAFAAWTSAANAQESFPNELNSPVDEPQVIVREQSDKVPVRMASQEIQQSTDPLVKLTWETREATRRRLLSTAQHTPWQMMHGLLGLRHDFLISHNGAAVNGLEWIRTGPMYQNEPWFQKTVHGGRAHPFSKPYWFEGHINQSLAILSQCELPLDTTFGTPDGPITMRDMLKNAQMTVNEKEEVTWTLWALCTYLPPDAKWVNAKGEQWSIERLVQIEVGKPVGGPTSPCGGTHGLYALARARNIYMATGKPLRGVWYQADQKIKKYIQISKNNQNPNGTLSSAFFKGKEYKQDFDKRMASTGHQLEFLMMAVDDRTLREPWLRRAVEATANDLMANRKEYVSCSPLYHATNALTIYLERTIPSQRQQNMAQRPTAKTISNSKELTKTPAPQTGPGVVPPVPKAPAATSSNVASTSTPASNMTKSGTTAATTTQPGAVASATPQVAPALKATPPIASQSPSVPDKSTATGTTPENKETTPEAKPVTVENPLTPVPLPDLTIPSETMKAADPVKKEESPAQPSTGNAPEILPKNDGSASPPAAANPAPASPEPKPATTPATAEATPATPMAAPPIIVDSKAPAPSTTTDTTSSSVPFAAAVSTSVTAVPVASPATVAPVPGDATTRDPVTSAERPEHSQKTEAVVPVLLSPVPLKKSPVGQSTKPAEASPSAPNPSQVPVKSISVSRDVTETTQAKQPNDAAWQVAKAISRTIVLPANSITNTSTNTATEPVAEVEQKPAEKTPDKKSPPDEKHRWKATPAERRRVTIQEEPNSSN